MIPAAPAPSPQRIRVLFVCLGNICRSPLAEGVFRHLVRARGLDDQFEIDSAGTGGWHAGERADPRMRAVARRHGIELESRARQVAPEDWQRFDWILAMDRDNLKALEAHRRAHSGPARLHLFRAFDPEVATPDIRLSHHGKGHGEGGLGKHADVPDPYYGGAEGFETVYTMVRRTSEALLDALAAGGLEHPPIR